MTKWRRHSALVWLLLSTAAPDRGGMERGTELRIVEFVAPSGGEAEMRGQVEEQQLG